MYSVSSNLYSIIVGSIDIQYHLICIQFLFLFIFSLIFFIFSQLIYIRPHVIYIQSHLICIQSDLVYIQASFKHVISHMLYRSSSYLFFCNNNVLRVMLTNSLKSVFVEKKNIYISSNDLVFGNTFKTKSRLDDCLSWTENELQLLKKQQISKSRKSMNGTIWNISRTNIHRFCA